MPIALSNDSTSLVQPIRFPLPLQTRVGNRHVNNAALLIKNNLCSIEIYVELCL